MAEQDIARLLAQRSFTELGARERARALLDAGSFRELLDPFARLMSPWLPTSSSSQPGKSLRYSLVASLRWPTSTVWPAGNSPSCARTPSRTAATQRWPSK